MWIAISLFSGVFAAAQGWCPGIVLPFTLALAGTLIASTMRRRPRWLAFAVVLAFSGAGALWWNARHAGPFPDTLAKYAAHHPTSVVYTLEGRVERPDVIVDDQDYAQFVLRVDAARIDDRPIDLEGGVLVRWTNPVTPLYPGDRVRAEGPLDITIGRVNHGVNGVEEYYRRRGVHTVLRIRDAASIERTQNGSWFSVTYCASRLRSHLAARLAQIVPESSLPFMLTVWLGERRRIEDDTYTNFLESGTAHILAVSGVHIGIIFITLNYILRLIIKKRRLRTLIIMAAVLLFALMAGARISSVRAAIMILLYLTADWFEREPDPPTAISIASILFILQDPEVIFSPGFQLSFTSIASLLIFREPIKMAMHSQPYFIREALSSTVAVQLLPLPIAVSLFHVMPLAGIAANLIVIPLLSIVLGLSFVTSIAAFIFPPLALLFAHAAHPFVQIILFLNQTLSNMDMTHRYLTTPTPIAMISYWAAIALVFAVLTSPKHRIARMLASFAMALVTLVTWNPVSHPAEATFIDVGHGDATFIRTPSGNTILVDTGDRNDLIDMGKRVVAPFLWSNHVSKLDLLLITHPDRDHIGGARYILDHFSVGTLVLGPHPFPTTLEDELIAQCKRRGVPVRRIAQGDSISLDEAQLDVLHPPRNWSTSSGRNDASLTVRVQWPNFSLLLPGDIEATGEEALAQSDPRATVLKVPHHGSKTSSSEAFIDAVNPTLAVISVGRRGRSSVLSQVVVQRYENRGVNVMRTDIVGGIRVRTDNQGNLQAHGARTVRGFLVRNE